MLNIIVATAAEGINVHAFDATYRNPENVLPAFHKLIIQYHSSWIGTNQYMAPYFSVFQASGYGKSRLLKEEAQNLHCFYISFASAASTAFPARSHTATVLLGKAEVLNNPRQIQTL